MVEVVGKRIQEWAEVRDVSTQALRSNVQSAKAALGADQEGELEGEVEVDSGAKTEEILSGEAASMKTLDDWVTVYRGRSENGKGRVTADGHRLNPRLDIHTFAKSGRLNWAGDSQQKQLALALLADVLETNDVSADVVDKFAADVLTKRIGSHRDEWEMTDNEIRAWVFRHTDIFPTAELPPEKLPDKIML
jgi:hypothetical protein